MAAVMAAERAAGRIPEDVRRPQVRLGRRVPGARRPAPLIEVKGRAEGATTVTVTRNEIGKCLNVPDRWYLAIVSVDGERVAEPIYLRRPFSLAPDPAATSVNYSIKDLLAQGELVEVSA